MPCGVFIDRIARALDKAVRKRAWRSELLLLLAGIAPSKAEKRWNTAGATASGALLSDFASVCRCVIRARYPGA
jgi:hypothetical protein